jgi:hypothetical protein
MKGLALDNMSFLRAFYATESRERTEWIRGTFLGHCGVPGMNGERTLVAGNPSTKNAIATMSRTEGLRGKTSTDQRSARVATVVTGVVDTTTGGPLSKGGSPATSKATASDGFSMLLLKCRGNPRTPGPSDSRLKGPILGLEFSVLQS